MLELLPPAEQHAYRLLVRLDGASAADLARVDGLSKELLESLRGKGLVTPGPVYRALPPDVALGDALLRHQESLEAARQVVAALPRGSPCTISGSVAEAPSPSPCATNRS